ncbi:SDR family NAD(P)-dependent oxidoreductase [Actinoplanes subtropicus]|uniref:SDR family NAD(P)-dependent oxidoreductase n=1 Tax=Actinoplanes subtropicus TaxID=543632 RepID=UPI0004C31E00|nr:SDR family NAD(P)-dependent oxidoreductase [Actinoplanes subtropicus]
MEFAGKVAYVTGGGSGIGAAVARRLSDRGADAVVVADVNAAAAEAVDVADPAQVEKSIEAVIRAHGRLDVVVHAAGVDDPAAKQVIADALLAGEPPQVTARLEDAAWRRVMSVNLDGTFHVLGAALRVMTPVRAGAIVVVGSSASFDAPIGYAHYAASKAGVHALCQSVAKEAIAFGVRVNVVAPGPTDTGMAARTPEPLRHSLGDGRVRPYATPEEIADVALFLAGDGAANLVGAVLLANGGRFTV